MGADEFRQRVEALRAEGRSPKQIARALGVRPAVVTPLVRSIATQPAEAPEPALVGCWVSPGWSVGLTLADDGDWPDRKGCGTAGSGLVGVVVARERPRRVDSRSVCGWLVDTYCLGVKDALGPLTMDRHDVRRFVECFFTPFDGVPVDAPIELARGLVGGGLAYARGLGFEPAPDFEPTAEHHGPLSGSSGIRFGHDGRPFYVQGPYDNADRIMRTLERSVGPDNFNFALSVPV